MPEQEKLSSLPSSPTQPNPVKSGINWLHVLVGVVIGALLIGGGFLTYNAYQSKPKESTPPTKTATSGATTSPQSSQPTTNDETADWKTFTDSNLKISFKYPRSWAIKLPNTDPMCGDLILISPTEKELGFCGHDSPAYFSLILITPSADSNNFCRDQTIQEVTVDQRSAVRCERVSQGPSEQFPSELPAESKQIEYYIGDTRFGVNYIQFPEKPNYEKEFELIISTFKFL